MVIIYSPALAVSATMLATAPAVNGREALIAGLLSFHFAKRVGEVLFVHRYSGFTGPIAYFISVFYALLSLLICQSAQHVPIDVYAAGASQTALPIALVLFAVGQLGNFYHHWLLAEMRKPAIAAPSGTDVSSTPTTANAMQPPNEESPRKVYVLPRGGLFDLVTMPHYCFEVIAWFGIALAAQQLNAILVAAGMTSYLSGRAVASTNWYKKQFGDAYPASRRHMVPFIF